MDPSEQVSALTSSTQQSEDKAKKAEKRVQLLTRLIRVKREKDSDCLLEEQVGQKEVLLNGFRHAKFGSFCLNSGDIVRAEEHLQKGRAIIEAEYPYSNVWVNLGMVETKKHNYQEAAKCFIKAIELSPHRNPQDYALSNQAMFSKELNSFAAYVDAHTNLSVMYSQLEQHTKALEYCQKSIELKPDNFESAINYTDILRQLGRKEEAIRHSWTQIMEYTKKTGNPHYKGFEPLLINSWEKREVLGEKRISILTVKWGARYNAQYVNKLYRGITKNTSYQIDNFYCFTDDESGLLPEITPRKLEQGWTKWWGKVSLFNCGVEGKKFYIDLDMIITGSLDDIFSYDGEFALLRSGDLQCQKNHKEGYNSSVMIWKDEGLLRPIYSMLKQNFEVVTKFISRFDFWLEMTINNADYVQKIFPNQVIDFLADAWKVLPSSSSIVCFARKPKPEDYPAEWIKQFWL